MLILLAFASLAAACQGQETPTPVPSGTLEGTPERGTLQPAPWETIPRPISTPTQVPTVTPTPTSAPPPTPEPTSTPRPTPVPRQIPTIVPTAQPNATPTPTSSPTPRPGTDLSNIRPDGPPPPKAEAHLPMVCGSCSKASAVAAAVRPWAKSSIAYHLSRSRGVGARIILRRRSLTPICHCSSDWSISLTSIINPRNCRNHLSRLSPNLPDLSAYFTLALV